MPQRAALEAAKDQLAYWRKEGDAAREANDAARLVECERFIAQCELMVSALTEVVQRK